MEWIVAVFVLAAVVWVIYTLVVNSQPADNPCTTCKGSGIEQTPMGSTYHVRCPSCSGSGHASV